MSDEEVALEAGLDTFFVSLTFEDYELAETRQVLRELSEDARDLVGRWPTGGTKPGTVLSVEAGLGLVVSTRGCPLLIRAAQLEGKARSESDTLLQQLRAQPGDLLGHDIET